MTLLAARRWALVTARQCDEASQFSITGSAGQAKLRRMASYLAPNWFVTKLMNPLVMLIGGATTLRVAGRTTGRAQTVPVNVLEHEGHRYLVAARGETAWVRNLRAAGQCTLSRRGKELTYRAEELPVTSRAPFIAAYRARWDGQVKQFFEKLPDAADHSVFRLEPTS